MNKKFEELVLEKLNSIDDRFNHLEYRLDRIDQKIDTLDQRITSLEKTVIDLDKNINKRLEASNGYFLTELNKVNVSLEWVQELYGDYNTRITKNENQIGVLNAMVLKDAENVPKHKLLDRKNLS